MKKGVVKNNRFSEILLFSVFIVIIGLVIVAAIMRHNFQSKNDMKKIEELTKIQNALENYFDNENAYPASLSLLAPKYIAAIPPKINDDDWIYSSMYKNQSYILKINMQVLTEQEPNIIKEEDKPYYVLYAKK
ncbi:MAG: hypothetical protein UT66_C0016G0002 [candidate division CPR2 bacterium GW2011_GWC1_39_9]|uniref:Type II secretion system protein GspG C-terminal domain-containing protein n=1 Tax=candidate division CPR2 bacterium GW2011_GWC2_39_10 TaxID=1618345 RepID=A0A0G0M3M5_UNCC2|nr:MAG: hypothetical protein UT18_C0006G0053 [candidate division CPR2 bacterium GW2011_GWC2_39_10]KKR34772.1 MAG: hypothetical protein UT66_C0016G0002 [candidate division CPR2 bacterium GW2011_GWC1_39_9]